MLDTSTPSALDIHVTEYGKIFVSYAHRQQIRLAHCADKCTDIKNWSDGLIHVDPVYSPPIFNNRYWIIIFFRIDININAFSNCDQLINCSGSL